VSESRNILVVANETLVGENLIDAVKGRAEGGEVAVHVICAQSEPKHGYVIYEDSVRDAVQNRLDMTLARLREVGVEVTGELMDPDPYRAIMDALGERAFDEVIISTHPETRSGWLRQDLVTRVRESTDRPVEHVVVELEASEEEKTSTLVVANQTVGGQALIDQLEELAREGPHRFVVICPQSGEGEDDDAPARLAHTLEVLEEKGFDAIGQVTHPDPYTAIQNALEFYPVDAIVISTFPETRSGWLRGDLVDRVRSSTEKPVHHVVSEDEAEHQDSDSAAESGS